jgi:hypothetical protein
MLGGNPALGADGGDVSGETIPISGDYVFLVRGGAMNMFAVSAAREREDGGGGIRGRRGSAGADAAQDGGVLVCHLMHVFAPPEAHQGTHAQILSPIFQFVICKKLIVMCLSLISPFGDFLWQVSPTMARPLSM